MNYKIALLKGDGIGPEIVDEAVKVLNKIGEKFGHTFEYSQGYLGGESIDKFGMPLTEETIATCKASDAVILGAVGGAKWDVIDPALRPEKGLLGIRKALGLYMNLRPAILYEALRDSSPLKSEIIGDGLDMIVIRELTGGIYFGERSKTHDEAHDTMYYSRPEIERIARKAFEVAMLREKRLMSVDKHNVLDSSKLWREVVIEVSQDYPEVKLDHMYVDNAAMQLVRNPKQFDVIVTGNIFGDILSDTASMVVGSIGLLPSASTGDKTAIYEPIHGSAPDIAGLGIANPIATILSAAMMLKYTLSEQKASDMIEKAIKDALKDGYRTKDLAAFDAKEVLNCVAMGNKIVEYINK